MASKILPLYSDFYYTYEVELGSKNYTLTFRYNQRLDLYVMDVQNPDEEMVIQGIPLTPFFPLLKPYVLSELSGFFCLVPYQVPDSGRYPEIEQGKNIWETHFLVYEE